MKKKIFLLFTSGILIFVAACAHREKDDSIMIQTKNSETVLDSGVTGVPEVKAAQQVSLPALMEKQYDGRELKLGKILAQNILYTRYYITYMSGDLKISGIMNVPKGKGPFGVVILNHGYIDPDIYTNGRGLKREQDYLAKQSFVVIHPDYRNHADSDKDPDSELKLRLGYVEDVINAVYAAKNSGFEFLDRENIFMLGHSMGGGVTINILVAKPNLIRAAVLFAPVSADMEDNFERWTKRRPEVAQKIIEAYGSPKDSPEFWKNVSAVNFLENVSAPVMIHHGTADKEVPIKWSEKFDAALREQGKSVVFYAYENEPHEFIHAWPQVMKRTVEFFKENIVSSPREEG